MGVDRIVVAYGWVSWKIFYQRLVREYGKVYVMKELGPDSFLLELEDIGEVWFIRIQPKGTLHGFKYTGKRPDLAIVNKSMEVEFYKNYINTVLHPIKKEVLWW